MWRNAALALVTVVAPLQGQSEPVVRRPATAAEVIAGNIIVGGITAAGRALFSGADPVRAFGIGALGGAVHVAGKNLAVEPAPAHGLMGVLVAGVGASIVLNGGRGVHPLRELTVPFASMRVRVSPFDERKLTVAVNLFESALIAHTAAQDGLRLDWSRSVSTGTAIFMARRKRLLHGANELDGLAFGPVVIISGDVRDTARVVRHEVVHAHQHWYIQDAMGRPIEDYLRPRIPLVRRLPRWLELGVVAPGLATFENWATNKRGVRRLAEAEADRLEVR